MLYSLNGKIPTELPMRIRLSDGTTRTGGNYTSEELSDSGYIEVGDKPLITNDISSVYWSSSDLGWKINYKTPEQKLYEATEKWKQERQYSVDSIIVFFNGTDIVNELTEEEEALMTDEELEAHFINVSIFQGDEKSQDRMNRAINSLPDETTTIDWLDYDNQLHQLNIDNLRKILYNAMKQQSDIWNLNRPTIQDFI